MRHVAAVLTGLMLAGSALPAAAATSGDPAGHRLVDRFVDDMLKRNPSGATNLGVHTYDDRLEDRSRPAIQAEIKALKDFQRQFAAIPASTLSPTAAADREMVLATIDSSLLNSETLRLWEKDPDRYTDAVTGSAFIKEGPLPLPLIRKAMPGSVGDAL